MNDTEWLNAIEKYGWTIKYDKVTKMFWVTVYTNRSNKIINRTLRSTLHFAYLTQLAWEQKNENQS